MRGRAVKAVGGAVALAVALAGVLLLRAEVMTVHETLPPASQTTFVIEAETREDRAHLLEMTRSLVSVCRLLVNGDVRERSFSGNGEGVFSFAVQPGLGEFDVREMRGCLQDPRVQHLLVSVRSVDTVETRRAPQGG